jgi:hypothetical protein
MKDGCERCLLRHVSYALDGIEQPARRTRGVERNAQPRAEYAG